MSSVLYHSGLNYQSTNPLRNEIRGLHKQVDELKWKMDVIMGAFDKMGGDSQEFIKEAFIAKQKEREEATAAAQSLAAMKNQQSISQQQPVNYGNSIASLQAQLNQPPGGGRRY